MAVPQSHRPRSDEDVLSVLASFVLEARTCGVLARQRAGLTPSQDLVLCCLALTDRLTPTALARQLGMSSGGLTASLTGLEERGLVSRTPHPGDGRSSYIAATDAGRALIDGPSRPLADELRDAIGELDATSRDVVVDLVRAWTDAYARHCARIRQDGADGG